MKTIKLLLLFLIPSLSLFSEVNNKTVLITMKTATKFMMDEVSYQGGFVWNYLPDFSRSWGELEAKRSMIWVQPPGTPSVGHTILDAYKVTKDDYYYKAALKIAKTLIKGQLPCGGWNYMFDLNGEDSLKNWYNTIGKNAWRLEEFQHYYGNATFDDAGTIHSAKFLLRLFLEKKDPEIGKALDKAINFVLESQYPVGGWPQRYPVISGFSKDGLEDYSGFITLNDDVFMENLDFLILCMQYLNRFDLKQPIIKALECSKKLQQPKPYAGWSDQYTLDLKPAHARTYEPRAVNTSTTVGFIYNMMDFYRYTGDTFFLSGIPAAIEFLDSQRLPESEVRLSGKNSFDTESFMVPRFVNPDNGKPQYVHRKGSNSANGQYYVDQNISGTISHYSSQAFINTTQIKKAFSEIKNSPLHKGFPKRPLTTFQTSGRMREFQQPGVENILENLNTRGYWPARLSSTSNVYKKDAPETDKSDDNAYATSNVGDEYDTSCFKCSENIDCISTSVYISNMNRLLQYLSDK